jgi:hypothetical protein
MSRSRILCASDFRRILLHSITGIKKTPNPLAKMHTERWKLCRRVRIFLFCKIMFQYMKKEMRSVYIWSTWVNKLHSMWRIVSYSASLCSFPQVLKLLWWNSWETFPFCILWTQKIFHGWWWRWLRLLSLPTVLFPFSPLCFVSLIQPSLISCCWQGSLHVD